MTELSWILHGPHGEDLRTSGSFASKEDAEAWMGAAWSSLRDEGAESVSLVSDGTVVYRMSLNEA